MLARLRRLALLFLLLATALYVVSLAAVFLASREDQRRPVEAIVVLGAAQYNGKPSPVLRARLDHAAELWREGLANMVVVTGGIGEGDRVSEATVGRQYLVRQGLPDSTIIVRPDGRSTAESIRSVAAWAADHGRRRVLLVSDPFHALRLRLEARAAGLTGFTSPTRTSPISARPRTEWLFLAQEGLKTPVVLFRSLRPESGGGGSP